MLRYDRQTKPGLVALYDIRPGNGAGPFLQPRSPHGAVLVSISLSVSTAIFPGEPGLAGFNEAKDDGNGGDNWSKAPVKSSPPTNQHPAFYRPDALPVALPTVSKH